MIDRKTKLLILTLIICGFALFQACAKNYTTQSGQALPATLGYAVEALEASKATYELGMGIAGELHCAGRISNDQAQAIIDIMGYYYLAHQGLHVAVDGWYTALADGGDTIAARQNVMEKWYAVAAALLKLAGDFEELTGQKLPVPELLQPKTISRIFEG